MSDQTPCLPDEGGLLVGRAWKTGVGPVLFALSETDCFDVTVAGPTMAELLSRKDAAGIVRSTIRSGDSFCTVDELIENSAPDRSREDRAHLLAPCDLQVIKAAGVTFAASLLERIIDEKAKGDPGAAAEVRETVTALIGNDMSTIRPGSAEAARVRQALVTKGMWSQYLEVGLGVDAEIFTKAPVMSAVGWGADVGIHPSSSWNNPEPEVVLAVNASGEPVGAALGNDVNLRDVEGRSALLLGRAKDNNASCAIGPFIRLFDQTFGIEDVRRAVVTLEIDGLDGFSLQAESNMSLISRDPLDLVGQTISANHQYPDGFMLFMGTMFAPVEDRGEAGQGFTHKMGDVVRISSPKLGTLLNKVRRTDEAPPWRFGITALMRNLSDRGLLGARKAA